MTPNTEELKALLEKATQGPWSFNRRTKEFGPISDHEDQSYGMILPIGDVFGDNWEANAILIAAAPDLAARVVELETALKGVLSVIDRPQSGPTICMSAEDAINSAANGLDLSLAALGAREVLKGQDDE